jgi:hypothetical protein
MRRRCHIRHLLSCAAIFVFSAVANSLIDDAVHDVKIAFKEWNQPRRVMLVDTSWDSGSYDLQPKKLLYDYGGDTGGASLPVNWQ